MKILLFFTYNKSFLSNFFMELASSLSDCGYQVVVYSLKGYQEQFQIGSVNVVIEEKGGYFTNYKHVYNIIKAEKPDVLIANFGYVNPALFFGKLLGVKNKIAWLHTLSNQINPSKKQVFIKRQFLKLADKVISNSQQLKNDLEQLFLVPSGVMGVVPFWFTPSISYGKGSFFPKSKQSFNIGCPGRLEVVKNQMQLLKVVEHLKDVDVHVYVVGDGKERSGLMSYVNSVGLQDKVTFEGILSIEDMQSFYKSMDLVVLPSLYEAFGLVFIEALAFGTPVLVSQKFGALDFIDGTNPYVENICFNPSSLADLKSKLLKAVNGDYPPRSFFKGLHLQYFHRDKIAPAVHLIIASSAKVKK